MVSCQSVIDDILDLRRNTVDRQRGYFYIDSEEDVKAARFQIDAIDVLNELKDYEVDLEETIMPQDADNPYYLDPYYNPNYSSVEYEGYLIENYLPDGWEVGRGDNSSNWLGNISNAINYSQLFSPDGEEYLVVRFHRWGDLRVNYSNDILCKMDIDDIYELETTYKSEVIEVDGEEYLVYTNLFNEGVEITKEDYSGDFQEEYYDYPDEESISEFIREKTSELKTEA